MDLSTLLHIRKGFNQIENFLKISPPPHPNLQVGKHQKKFYKSKKTLLCSKKEKLSIENPQILRKEVNFVHNYKELTWYTATHQNDICECIVAFATGKVSSVN